jgi:hypothetical protein
VFNHEWQQVSHTSQPENVWPQTFELLNSPQFKGISHGGTEAPVTERAARAAKNVAASFIWIWIAEAMRLEKNQQKKSRISKPHENPERNWVSGTGSAVTSSWS